MEREQIIKALELHSQGAVACLHECPYGDLRNCGSAMARDALSLIKELTAENTQFRYEQRKLIEERDTFREYAHNMQKYVENIRHKEEEGYEPSAARSAAEMEMWHAIALRENELIEDSREKDKTISNLIETIKSIQADTVRKMQTEIKKTFSAICKGEMVDLYRIIDQIAKEMLEEGK